MYLKIKELEQICNRVKDLAMEVGDFIQQEAMGFSSGKIETKGVHNYVTYVDKGAEEKLTKGLSIVLPDTGFITEEETTKQITKEYTWIIDPLDGTTNFIHGHQYRPDEGKQDHPRTGFGSGYSRVFLCLGVRSCLIEW